MSLNKKIVAFDLDGTLTESKQPISSEMADLITKLSVKVIVVIISGGTYSQFQKQFLPFLSSVELIKSNLILLPTSGSQCYEFNNDLKQWQLSDEVGFSSEMRFQVIKAFKEIVNSDQYDIPKQHWGEIIEDRGTQITFSALGQEAPIIEKQKWDPDQKKRQKIRAELEKFLPEVRVGIGGMTSIDVLSKGFNKATGLRRLTDRLGYKLVDLIFVGDAIFPGGNDYSVFEAGIETVQVRELKDTMQFIRGLI